MSKSEVVYSTQTSGFEPGKAYRNPKYFQATLGRPDKVVVVGDWPRVADAYRALGVEVEVSEKHQAPKSVVVSPVPPIPPELGERVAVAPQASPSGPAPDPEPLSPPEDIKAVRAEYKAVLGKNAFNGWPVEELRRRIAEHKAQE